ncbi:MAG: shikimate dehydrogenase [Pseudomonadota bacterium]
MAVVDRYAVVGNPVSHSLSPRIHEAFARDTGQSLRYDRIEAPLDGFAETVQQFFAAGGRGLNVTVPFKGDAARWVDRRSDHAAFAKAVNTIVLEPDGSTTGHNTDGLGLMLDLERLLPAARGDGRLRVLLLGAGGAARGVARPLLEGLARELVIANRTLARAEELVANLDEISDRPVTAVPFNKLDGGFDLVINATSAGLDDAVPTIEPAVIQGAFCYDMVYGGETAFCRWSRESGASAAADGLGMLVAQAAFAFKLWRGVRPDLEPVLSQLGAGS